MSKKSEIDLFLLIKSLTKSEKKSFTLYTNQYSLGEKKYARLFEIIDSQKQYDESLIKQIFKTEKILRPLPAIKKYLTELILKSLRIQHSEKTTDGRIRKLISDIEMCNSKGLFKLRDKKSKQAKQIAEKFEKHEVMLIILNKDLEYSSFQSNNTILAKIELINERIRTIGKYKRLAYSVENLLMKGEIKDEKLKQEWDELIRDSLLNQSADPFGYEEKYYYHRILKVYYRVNGDVEKTLHHAEALITYLETRQDFLVMNAKRYMATLIDLIIARCMHGNIKRAEEAFNKLLNIQEWELDTLEKKILRNHICLAYGNLIMGFEKTNCFDKGLEMAANAEIFIKNDNNINPKYKSILLFNLSTIYVCTGKYKKALVWINILMNESLNNYNEDMHPFAKILNLIIHYEMGNTELLPYLIRSTYRFLYKNKRLYKTEDAILQFMRNKMPNANSQRELISLFKELKFELEEIVKKDVFEAKVIEHFDFISWLSSKIENKSLLEIHLKKNIT